MWAIIKSIFSFEGVGESALKIVDKIAGTDWTPEQRANYHLKIMEATKHQSKSRRVIAYMVATVWFFMSMTWLLSTVAGRFFYDESINTGTALAADISAYIDLNIDTPFNIILGFYFTMNIAARLKG